MGFDQELREFVAGHGGDLLGIASIDRFTDLPKEKHPASIFPEVKSVIVVGKRIARGALRGVEEGTQFQIYDIYGRDWLENRVLAMLTFKTAVFLEDHGWESVPLPDLPPEVPPLGVAVREGSPAPNVMLDFMDMAVRAGLGEIGYGGFLLTPQFGPRQRVQVILTDAEFQPTPICDQPIDTLSLEERMALCPLGAIPAQGHELEICGKKMLVGEIEYAKCRACENGARPNPYHKTGRPDRLGAVCARNYMVELEERGAIANTFNNPFRKRPVWSIVNSREIRFGEDS